MWSSVRSYLQPIIVISSIPIGFAGIVFGVWVLDYNVSFQLLYATVGLAGVIVNGLVVLGADPGVVGYYRDEVIRGPGAFTEVALGFDTYRAAMQHKLLREVEGLVVSQAAGQ